MLISGVIFWQSFETPVYSQNRALRLEQVTNSLNISDDKPKESAITAKKVRQVGVSFPLTLEAEKALRFWGATDELIEAVRQNSPRVPKPITQTLTVVTSPPESEVYVDDVLMGITDAAGKAKFADVTVGEHRVVVRKPRYRDTAFPLFLDKDKEGQITANLEMAVGFLTITTNVPNAVIDIPGMGSYRNSINKLEFPTGVHAVTIANPFYVTSRREMNVSPGQEGQYSVTLEVDSAARDRLIAEAKGAYGRKQYDRAISSAKWLLSEIPKDSQALTVLAESYFMKYEFNSFMESAKRAIDAEGSLEFNLQHHDLLSVPGCITCLGERLHPVKVTLTSMGIALDPQAEEGVSCSFKKFSFRFEYLSVAQPDETRGGFFKKGAGTYLKIVLKDDKNPKKTYTLNFADPGSVIVKDTRGIITMRSRAEAAQSLNALSQVIRYASLQNP